MNPNGRPKGSPNKVTMQAREAIAMFVEGNVDRLTGWLDRIAEDDPKDAFNAFMSVVEYHVPKLARTEHVGDKDNPVSHEVSLTANILALMSMDQLKQIKNSSDS